MKFAQDHTNEEFLITAYEPGKIRISQTTYDSNVLLTPKKLIQDWALENIEEISVKVLYELVALKPELILFGTGSKQIFPHPRKLVPLIDEGIGFEIMDTASACRTYNILLAEDRNVMAALIV